MGGLGLPLLYYIASQLKTIYTYLHDHSMKMCTQREGFTIAPYDLRDVLWNAPINRPRINYSNPF